jgi:hypothetical protein
MTRTDSYIKKNTKNILTPKYDHLQALYYDHWSTETIEQATAHSFSNLWQCLLHLTYVEKSTRQLTGNEAAGLHAAHKYYLSN